MGKLKQHIMETSELKVKWILVTYGQFLQQCMKDHSIPSTWRDAITWISQQQVHERREAQLSRLQIEQVLIDNTESLYEGD